MGKVIVAGSINIDFVFFADRRPKTGETVRGDDYGLFPGGKGANTARAARNGGAEVDMVAKVGRDLFGPYLRDDLKELGINVAHVQDVAGAKTGAARIDVVKGDNNIIVVPSANDLLTVEDVARVDIAAGDVLVSQFEIPKDVIEAFFRIGKEKGAITVLNPSPFSAIPPALMELTDILVVNETEFAALSAAMELPEPTQDNILYLVWHMDLNDGGIGVVVTRGDKGLVVVGGASKIFIPGCVVEEVDSTGAGDCMLGNLAARLADGDSLVEAAKFSNAAGALSVEKTGAGPSMPKRSEVLRRFPELAR